MAMISEDREESIRGIEKELTDGLTRQFKDMGLPVKLDKRGIRKQAEEIYAQEVKKLQK